MGKKTVIAALLLSFLMTAGAVLAQGGSGSDWQYCNAFNVVTPEGTPGGPDYGDSIPSWYTTDYSSVTSYTPVSTWRRASFELNASGEEVPVRMSHENVVLRLDLLSGTDNVELRGVKLTLFGSRDFDPNEDLAPIHPESTAVHYSVDVTEADTLTGVQFYIDKGVSALSDVDILDRVDILGIAEQLIIDTLIQPRNTYDPTSPSYRADTLLEANKWSLDSTAANGWKWWSATLYFEDAINVPYEATFNSSLYGLPFYRIWIALQMAGCHECATGDIGMGGIEGISNSDSFYVEIAEREDLICYRYNAPIIDLVDMTSTLTDVLHGNPYPDPADASRWARSEMIKGWDEIPPFINQLWPRNLISTNDWYSDSVLCEEINDSIFTADEEQPISVTTQDFGTCVDSAFMEIRYINDEFLGTSPGSQFPGRIDSIIWRNPLEYAYDDTNGGNETGWLWQYKHSWRFSGSGPWSTTGWTTMSNTHSEAYATWIHPQCGTDSFVVMVGNDSTMNRLPMFDDGAYVQVLFRTFSRTNNFRYDYGFTLSPGVMNDTIWTFKVDLSGPNAELDCPSDEGHDNETEEFAAGNVRRDYIEGAYVYWRWLADSLPTLRLDVYDDYHAVHDITNHGINTYPGAVGGSGINWRDFEITFAIEHCTGEWDSIIVNENDLNYGVYVDEEDNGYNARMFVNFEELVTYHPGWSGIVPFQSGDFVHVLLTELVDDPDYGQRWDTCMLGDWMTMPPYWNEISWVIDPRPSGSWGIAEGADGNYGTRNTQDNHVPVMWEAVGICSYYTEYAYDTLGILRIDLEGPTAPDTFYYPPDQWVTSDSFQIITCDIYDQIGCEPYDLNVSGTSMSLRDRVSGVYSGSLDEEARICVNLKVRGCDGSWHPYYHTGAGSIPDGRNFCVGEPDAVGLELSKKYNEWGLRVTWDPYRTDTDEAHFRPGDKVCVTVYAWDNAITDCQAEDGTAGPVTGWDDDNDPWTPAEFDSAGWSLYCSDGSLAHFVDHEVPSRNSGYDRLDPDYLYYEVSHIARWNFYVDTHAPVFTGADMSQVCNDTMYLYFHDVSANVHGMYCDEWIANIGVQHTELVEGADLLLIFEDTMTTPGVTYVDTIIFQNMKLSGGAYPMDVHMAYHDIPGREYQYYYAELIKDPDDDRGAYVQLYGDGTEATCHFFQPYDHVRWELYAGDSPDVPWYPATQRTVSGGRTYRWWHQNDVWSNPGTWFMSWRYGDHDYEDLNVDTLDWPTFWEDTVYDDFENPNWDLVQVDSLQIFPQTWLANVGWYNDEAYDAFMVPPHTYNYPPDLKGDYTNVWHAWMGRYLNLDPDGMEPELQWEEGDSSLNSNMESRDPYVDAWVNDLNFIVADIYTCTDSIIWECLVGTDPDEDTLPFRVPHIVIDLYDAEGEHVWTIDEYYDCHCDPCFMSYYPSRTACVDWGRLHVGPIDQTEEWLYTIRRIDTLETDPLVTDTIIGWQHLDSIAVRLEFNVREPNDFGDDTHFTKYVFRWDYLVDMQAPTAVFRDPDATTGYNEVNCELIHDSNHTIRLRLEDIVDEQVGCAPGTLMAPNWTTQWPIPAVDPTSDWVVYDWGTMPPVDASMVWNPSTHYIWSNESFVVSNCAEEDEVADTMTIGTPGIEIYHGLDRSGGGFPTPIETHLDRDTIYIADSIYAEAIIQDRLGNYTLKTSRKVGLDNGLPEVKGFALSTWGLDTIGYDSLGVPILSDPYMHNWDEDLFKLPWEVPDQDSIVGIYNFTEVCTVYVRLWFNDNMDMREADHLYGHIVRFQPHGWTHWFPVLPLETVGGGSGGLHYPLAQRYVDYSEISGVMPTSRPGFESEADESPLVPGEAEFIDNGWNSDREWIGYMIIAGDGAMDGIGKLRVQGFDDNGGNYMLPIEYPIRIVTGDPEYRTIYWPRIDTLDDEHVDPWSSEPDDVLRLSGWSVSEPSMADSTRCSFYEDEEREHPITAYWDNELAETDSIRFLIWWHEEPWAAGTTFTYDYTYHWLEDNMYSGNISIYNDTSWVTVPTDDIDLLHEYYTTLGGAPVAYSNNEMYATIVFEAFSRFRPTNPYIADTLLNVLIDNRRPDPALTNLTGGQVIHGNHTVLPFGSTDLKVCWEDNQTESIDKISVWLHSLIDDSNYMLYPAGGVPGNDFGTVDASAPVYYDPVNEVLCLEYNDPSGLPAGMWTVSWKAFDGIHVVDTAASGVIENYWQYYHTDCEYDFFDADTLTILRPPFLARGDDLEDALMSVSDNYPAVMESDDIFPWWDSAMEDMWPDWPTWGWIDTAAIAAAGMPDLWRVDSLHRVPQIMPVVQVTTFNNPDYSSGDPDPLMHPYVESGGYPGDSIYVLLEVLPTDVNVDYIDLNIQDYWGGNISGSNLEINVRLDSTDIVTVGDRMFWVYKWEVDDQDNRYDGLVTMTATEHTFSPADSTWNDWDHLAYILLDTYDPKYEVSMLRSADATVPNKAINPIDFPDEEYIWVVNAEEFLIDIDWDETIFDPASPGDPVSYWNYGNYIYTRMWDHWRITIDGMPHYGTHVDDPNDHLEARLWDDDLDAWDIHHPFWRQPDYMNGAMTPSSYDDAEAMYTFDDQLGFFGDDIYTYEWEVAGLPEGIDAQGIAYILGKSRDAAGNVLDYEEARLSESEGKLALVDIEAPTIDSSLVLATGENFTAYVDAIWDNFLGDNFTNELGDGYVYVMVTIDTVGGSVEVGPFWVDETGAVATTPWGPVTPTPGDVVEVCAYDLAGNETCIDVDVVPEEHCCTYDLCTDWNLIAISVDPETLTTDVFGGAPVYKMIGGSYVPYTGLLEPGMGYAVYPASEMEVTICGAPVESFDVALEAGWNLIGATWTDVPFTAPDTDPAGAIDPTETRWYECGVDYIETDTLRHCRGHLVMVTEPDGCSLHVPGARGGKVVYTVKDGQFDPLFTGRLVTDNRTLTFGAANIATDNFDRGIDHFAVPAHVGQSEFVLNDGLDIDYRTTDSKIEWTVNATGSYSATLEVEGDWIVSYDGVAYEDGDVIEVTPGSHKLVADRVEIPDAFALGQNLPNPFNAVTAIKYELPEDTRVTLEVYSVLGQKVATLVNGDQEAGYRTVVWDGSDDEGRPVPSGIYFYKISAGDFKATRKMTLMK